MECKRLQRDSTKLWSLVKRQHGVIARQQLLGSGLNRGDIMGD
jgi:hypothetical protein